MPDAPYVASLADSAPSERKSLRKYTDAMGLRSRRLRSTVELLLKGEVA